MMSATAIETQKTNQDKNVDIMNVRYKEFEKYTGRIVYCTMASPDRFEETFAIISKMKQANGVSRVILVYHNSGKHLIWSDEQLNALRKAGIECYIRNWNGSFVDARNFYLSKCQYGDWVIVSDSDEHFNDLFINNLPAMFKLLDSKGFTHAKINAHDITYPFGWKQGDPEPPELVSDHMKLLVFKYLPGTYYDGVGETKTVHETLLPHPDLNRLANLPKDVFYRHIKYEHDIWERAARNVFIGGGGNNVGHTNPEWSNLLAIVAELGFTDWYDLSHYMKAGHIDQKLFDWLIRNRQTGLDWQNEMVDMFKYYFYYLHPEEKPSDVDVITEMIFGSVAEVLNFVEETYLRILKRHPSNEEKTLYADHIHAERVERNDLENIFMESPEYKAILANGVDFTALENGVKKETAKADEIIERLPLTNLPVHVEIQLTPNVIDQILKHSDYYNLYLKELTRMGYLHTIYMGINNKIETDGHGDDKQPRENYLHYIKDIVTFMNPDKFPRLLDLGAGAGDETIGLLEAGYDVTGLTLGVDNVKLAKEQYGIELLNKDMHSLDFPKGFFDCAALIHTYEHAYNPSMLLGELYHVLRDHGRIYVSVPDPKAESNQTIWHVNLREAKDVIYDFSYWGFVLIDEFKSPDATRNEFTFVFEKLPPNHADFKNYNYLRHIIALREKM